MKIVNRQLKPAVFTLLFFTLVTGLFYPLVVTILAQALFPHQANGSLVLVGDTAAGSELIGQAFDNPRYFWSRPSATQPFPYNAAASSGANLGPTNRLLLDRIQAGVPALQAADPGSQQAIPVDLVTASASGLDPHISPAAAYYQAARVARARGLDLVQVEQLIADTVEDRQFGILGEPRVNALRLNLALDRLQFAAD